MFADDTNISYSSDSLDGTQYVLNSELENLNSWLIADKLSLNITKTEFIVIGLRQSAKVYECYSKRYIYCNTRSSNE